MQIPPDVISEHEEFLIRFHADDSMGFKGFALSYIAVDPLDDDSAGPIEEEEEESGEIQPTYFPGYYGGGSLKNQKKNNNDNNNEDDYEEPEETNFKKPDEDLDEDLVTDNEDNFIYNSNRINKENSKIAESNKKNDKIDEEEDDDV